MVLDPPNLSTVSTFILLSDMPPEKQPSLISDLCDAYGLAGKGGAEVDFAFVEADSATTSDSDGAIVKRVIGLRRWLVEAG